MKAVPVLLALTLLGATATSAGATPASSATAGSLCSVGKSIASSLAHSAAIAPTAGTSIASLQKQLKATFTHIKSAETVVLANAPASLKPHFVKVFAFDNKVYAELSKAHWNILALAKNAGSFEAEAAKIKPDLLAIEAYFKKCK